MFNTIMPSCICCCPHNQNVTNPFINSTHFIIETLPNKCVKFTYNGTMSIMDEFIENMRAYMTCSCGPDSHSASFKMYPRWSCVNQLLYYNSSSYPFFKCPLEFDYFYVTGSLTGYYVLTINDNIIFRELFLLNKTSLSPPPPNFPYIPQDGGLFRYRIRIGDLLDERYFILVPPEYFIMEIQEPLWILQNETFYNLTSSDFNYELLDDKQILGYRCLALPYLKVIAPSIDHYKAEYVKIVDIQITIGGIMYAGYDFKIDPHSLFSGKGFMKIRCESMIESRTSYIEKMPTFISDNMRRRMYIGETLNILCVLDEFLVDETNASLMIIYSTYNSTEVISMKNFTLFGNKPFPINVTYQIVSIDDTNTGIYECRFIFRNYTLRVYTIVELKGNGNFVTPLIILLSEILFITTVTILAGYNIERAK